MDNRILAIIIISICVLGVYGLFYATYTSILIPQDVNEFKNELKSIEEFQAQINSNNTNNQELIQSAELMEQMVPLNYLNKEQRKQMANKMRISNSLPGGLFVISSPQNFNKYYEYNNNRIFFYKLILREDISSEITNISNTYKEIERFRNETLELPAKMANDFENGDNKAYAEDLRKISTINKNYNLLLEKLETQLTNLIKKLES